MFFKKQFDPQSQYFFQLTWYFHNFFICHQIQLIEYSIMFRQIFISTLFLFTTKYGTIDCKINYKKIQRKEKRRIILDTNVAISEEYFFVFIKFSFEESCKRKLIDRNSIIRRKKVENALNQAEVLAYKTFKQTCQVENN